jgi:hypothetical protein
MTVTAGILAEAWIKRYYEFADAGDMDGAMEYVAPTGCCGSRITNPSSGARRFTRQ